MCGIAGFWAASGGCARGFEEKVRRMVQAVRHRGPDDAGVWVDAAHRVGLGHARLSIIDLSAEAHQPMTGPSARTRIVFNGEMYNYIEKRQELQRLGVSFKTQSDTEVILALYERQKEDCVESIRGMFAFALWDESTATLLLARDRLGKKPLYYCRDASGLYFGSEIKSVIAGLGRCPEIDPIALDGYLAFGFVSGDRTIYQGIHELPPGTLLRTRGLDVPRPIRYWSPRWTPKLALSEDAAVDETAHRLEEAVRIRLRADVPVGIFLSGGIDSGLVTALAAGKMGVKCQTFSVGFEDGIFDERPLARQVARQYGTDHHEVVLKPNVVELIPKIAWHYDEPFADPSAVPSFAIAEFARRHVKVVLNGDGGDEVFNGYRRHVAAAIKARLGRVVPAPIARVAARGMLSFLPEPRSFRTPYAFTHRFLRGLAEPAEGTVHVWWTDGFSEAEKASLYLASRGGDHGRGEIQALPGSLNGLENLDLVTALDLCWYLPGDLLVKMDIACMAYGLEARSPFLDHELVEWAIRLPGTVRLPGLITKPLLRKLAFRYLPQPVACAPKRGFEVPLHRWLTEELREARDDLILSRRGIVCDLFDRGRVEQLLRNPDATPGRWAQLVWVLFMLAVWEAYSRAAAGGPGVGRQQA